MTDLSCKVQHTPSSSVSTNTSSSSDRELSPTSVDAATRRTYGVYLSRSATKTKQQRAAKSSKEQQRAAKSRPSAAEPTPYHAHVIILICESCPRAPDSLTFSVLHRTKCKPMHLEQGQELGVRVQSQGYSQGQGQSQG